MKPSFADMRISYQEGTIADGALLADPFDQFRVWFDEVRATNVIEANALVLSTVDASGAPNARTLLMKGVDATGILIYTNYDSVKGEEIAANPHVCALFYWPTLQRQVRWRGVAERLTDAESDAYFQTRPRGSQIGAHASPQSQPVLDRAELERRYAEADGAYAEALEIPRPASWGGYRIVPTSIEFWQGRENRLHDRFQFDRQDDGGWSAQRLAP